MADEVLQKEVITVDQVSKFGVRVGEVWYNINRPLQPTNFLPNKTYTVGIKVSTTGKKYISEIVSDGGADVALPVSAKAEVAKVVEESKKTIAKRASTSNADDSKRTDIQRQGFFQAALQSPAPLQWASNLDEYIAQVRALAEAGLKFVNEDR